MQIVASVLQLIKLYFQIGLMMSVKLLRTY